MRSALSLRPAAPQAWATTERVAACIAGLLLLNYFCWIVVPGSVLPAFSTVSAVSLGIGFLCWEVSQGRFVLALAVVGGFFLLFFAPPVDWDARSIWFFHAKRMFFDGALTTRLDRYAEFAQLSYADLLPATFASIARVGGVWNEFLPKLGLLLGLLPPFMILIGRRKTAGTCLLMLGGLLFAADRELLNGDMDAPLALYVVAATVLLREAALREDGDQLLVPIIVLLGAAASIKDEGAVMAAILGVPWVLLILRRRRGAAGLAKLFAIAALVVVPLIIWKLHTHAVGLESGFLSGDPFARAWARLMSQDFVTIRRAIWNAVSAPIAALLLVAYLRNRIDARVVWFLGCYLSVLFLVYLVTPHDVAWHLATSLDRVTLMFSLMSVAIVVIELESVADERWARVPS